MAEEEPMVGEGSWRRFFFSAISIWGEGYISLPVTEESLTPPLPQTTMSVVVGVEEIGHSGKKVFISQRRGFR